MAIDLADKKRINIYVPEHIVDKIDDYAQNMGLNRSSMISVILKQYIDQQDMLELSKLAQLKSLGE